jgi:hypothetical protein
VPRVKQFDDLIEENPDFIVLRNHIAKSVTGDGKKIELMGSVWRLLRQACKLSQGMPYAKSLHVPTPPQGPPQSAQIGPVPQETVTHGQESASVAGEGAQDSV